MRRIAPLALVVALIAAACGDDDATDSDTSTSSTAAATSSTVAATSSTAAPTTTTQAATTTAAGNPQLEQALALVGTYSGTWNNTTFGSSGPIDLSIEVNEAAQFATITLDLGGFVFGGDDPDPVVWEVDFVTGDLLGGSGALFGVTTAEMDENGRFLLSAPAVPGVGGLSLTVEGDFTAAGFSGTYVITDLAEGTIEGTATG